MEFGAADAARLAEPLVGALAAVSREGSGWDHVAWRVDAVDGSSWIVRAASGEPEDDWAEGVRREAAVMRVARQHVGSIVADPVVLDEGRRCLAYLRLPGVPLQELLVRGAVPAPKLNRLAVQIGGLVAAIAGIDPAETAEPIPLDDDEIDAWRADLPTFMATIDGLLAPKERAAIERFLATPSPPAPAPDELVLCHNDVGAEHVLVDPATLAITGIIDWTDAAIADPAAELGRLVRDLGVDGLEAVLDGMGSSGERRAGLVQRGWSYARCLIVEDLAHAVEHRRDLIAFELASLGRLFAGV